MTTTSATLSQHFEGREPEVKSIYERIVSEARKFGNVIEEPKKTSIHLSRTTAFAGVATRKQALILTLKASANVPSPRITKHEQVSTNRWHLDVRLSRPDEVDDEIVRWLADAYVLAK